MRLSKKMAPRQRISKFTYIMAFLILLVAILAALCLIIRKNPFDFTKSKSFEDSYCFKKECISESKTLLYNMKPTLDPCDDFYEFACGNFANENLLKADEVEISEMKKLDDITEIQLKTILEEPPENDELGFFKNMKIYYKDCIDKETINKRGLAPFKEIFDSIGGWPVVDDKEPENNWETVLFAMRDNNLESMAIMEQSVSQEYTNSSKRIIVIRTPSLSLPQEVMSKGKSDKTMQDFLKYITNIAILFGAKPEVAARDMEDVLDFQILLAKASKSREEKKRDQSALNNIYTIRKLEEDFPKFPWMQYINSMTPKNFTVTSNMRLQVEEPEYINKLIDYLEITPNRTIINYFIVKEVASAKGILNDAYNDVQQQFFADVLGQESRIERSKECVQFVKESFGPLISSLYIRKLFDSESKTVATEMVNYLKDTFKKMLEEANWTSEDKKQALEKIETMNKMIGYPDELVDDVKLGEIFNSVEIVEGDFFKSNLLIGKFTEQFYYNRLNLPVNKTDWIDYSSIASATAYYSNNVNIIGIPAGILQGGLFNPKRPNYSNFAAIGSIIAHEISHGFDESGRQYDKNGDLRNWMSKQAIDDFTEKKKCIVEQFDKYTIFDGQHVKGSSTVSENLADFGGQKLAYLAYQNWMKDHEEEQMLPGLNYTVNQLYWLSAASVWCTNEKKEHLSSRISIDIHSPNRYRVNGPLSNLEEFSRDYQCQSGTNMNPVNKCKPW